MKELVLNDGRYIMSFAVDEKNNRLYAYCPNEIEHDAGDARRDDYNCEIPSDR